MGLDLQVWRYSEQQNIVLNKNDYLSYDTSMDHIFFEYVTQMIVTKNFKSMIHQNFTYFEAKYATALWIILSAQLEGIP